MPESERSVVPICVRCGKRLESVDPEDDSLQPHGGVICTTGGNYGSRVLDVIYDPARIEFVLCDQCLVWLVQKGRTVAYRTYGRPEEQRISPFSLIFVDGEPLQDPTEGTE
jgi:DNA-directed RNA polymerase subunit RPC12/RpoP